MALFSVCLSPSRWPPFAQHDCSSHHAVPGEVLRLPLLSSRTRIARPACEMTAPSRHIPQVLTRLTSNVCATSLAALALSGANEALASIGDGNAASSDFATANPERMYALIAIEAVALIGAAVGGTLARQRKEELERMNAQLRRINEFLRSKAMIETYAPGLVYAPVGRPEDDKALDAEREALFKVLNAGKKFLKEKKPQLAYNEFKKALPIAQRIGDPHEVKKAARGLGVSCQRQGRFREAIKFHMLVLEVSGREEEICGDTEALGSIADCYCELGDLDAAQKYYNQYIDRLATDDDPEG